MTNNSDKPNPLLLTRERNNRSCEINCYIVRTFIIVYTQVMAYMVRSNAFWLRTIQKTNMALFRNGCAVSFHFSSISHLLLIFVDYQIRYRGYSSMNSVWWKSFGIFWEHSSHLTRRQRSTYLEAQSTQRNFRC